MSRGDVPLRAGSNSRGTGQVAYEALKKLARQAARSEAPQQVWDHNASRAFAKVDAFVDALFAENPDRPVSCRLGCHHCCHQWVYDVHPPEIDRLGRWIVGSGCADEIYDALRFREATYRQIEATVEADTTILEPERETAYRYLGRGLPCVFLSADGQCQIYERRPYTCRTFFSLSEPEACTEAGLRSGRNQSFFVEPHPVTESVWASLSATWEASSGALVSMLLRWLEARPAR